MGSFFSQQNADETERQFRDMSGNELMSVYGMTNTQCNRKELSAFLEKIHRDEIDLVFREALLGSLSAETQRTKEKFD